MKKSLSHATFGKPSTVLAMNRVIDLLAQQECTTIEVSAHLGFSRSGARRYIRDLEDAGLLVRRLRAAGQFDLVRIVDDEGKVQMFRRKLATEGPTSEQMERARKRREAKRAGQLLPGTIVHQIVDDNEIKVRRLANAQVVVRRDPLIAALFGAPAQQGGAV